MHVFLINYFYLLQFFFAFHYCNSHYDNETSWDDVDEAADDYITET